MTIESDRLMPRAFSVQLAVTLTLYKFVYPETTVTVFVIVALPVRPGTLITEIVVPAVRAEVMAVYLLCSIALRTCPRINTLRRA